MFCMGQPPQQQVLWVNEQPLEAGGWQCMQDVCGAQKGQRCWCGDSGCCSHCQVEAGCHLV